MTIVYLGLGSNIKDKEEHLKKAILLIKDFCMVNAVSPLYLTEPVGFPDQDWFLNCAVEIETDVDPQTLLSKIKSIERKLRRKKTIKNGPRSIDIDILFYGDLVMHTKQLVIPHPRLQERLFVLQPMLDLNPTLMHPVLHKTIQELYNEHPWSEIVTPFK
jgi:2-amino-4-hydroxy-6-hydroxymethyldihydropteridine diphosphokinase